MDEAQTASGTDSVLCWKSYGEGPAIRSIPRYVEVHAERLRAKYLAFAHDLGERQVAGKRIIDHFQTGTGFSLWWMTRIPEKSPFKSPRIDDCLRLMALEEILLQAKPSALTLYTADSELAEAVSRLCANLQIAFGAVMQKRPRRRWSIRRLYEALPHLAQGLLSFRHAFLRWPFRRLRPVKWFCGDKAVFLCSYFFNLDQAACEEGQFYSRQWEMLPRWLLANGMGINWVHHFLPVAGMRDVQTTLAWVQGFNRDADRQGAHAFLETYLSWKVVIRAFRRWASLSVVAWRLRAAREVFTPGQSAASFWPLLRNDWWISLLGTTAVSNCLWLELFDAALEDLPHQERGLYLFEGQGWESALLHAWRRHGHGEIVGVPHSSMPFWYLNIYDDPRCVALTRSCQKPLPDYLALNGPMAWRALRAAGYPVEHLIEVEGLRFQYLLSLKASQAARPKPNPEFGGRRPPKLLVLGDVTREQTLKMLSSVEAMARLVNKGVSITVKLHPACRVDTSEVSTLQCDFTDRPLADIVNDFDFAFSSNSTSAGLDALLAGLPVAVFLDDEHVNHSPLRGVEGVRFVSTPRELADALQEAEREPGPALPIEDFFWLDEQLPRWRRALSIPGETDA